MSSRLVAERLGCVRGGRRVFAGAGFVLEPGEALLLRGPNGSGKSSLLRILAGFLAPAFGWVSLDGERDPGVRRQAAHYVGHRNGIKTALSVRENLAFASAVQGGTPADVDAALEAFELGAFSNLEARLLSAGQTRRLALARLLATRRSLWLLDEPGVGLDTRSRSRLEDRLHDHLRAGGLVVAATHGDIALPGALVLELAG